MDPMRRYLRDRRQKRRDEKSLQGQSSRLQTQPEESGSEEASDGMLIEDDEGLAIERQLSQQSNSREQLHVFELPQYRRNRKLSQPNLDRRRTGRKLSQLDLGEKLLHLGELDRPHEQQQLLRIDEGQRAEEKQHKSSDNKLTKVEDPVDTRKGAIRVSDKLPKSTCIETKPLKRDTKSKVTEDGQLKTEKRHLSTEVNQANDPDKKSEFSEESSTLNRHGDTRSQEDPSNSNNSVENEEKQRRKGDKLKWLGRKLHKTEEALMQHGRQQGDKPHVQLLQESQDKLGKKDSKIDCEQQQQTRQTIGKHQLQKIQEEKLAIVEEEQKRLMKLRLRPLFPTDRQLRLRSVIGRGWLRLPLGTARCLADVELEKVSTVLQRWEALQLAETLRLHGASQRLRCLEKSLAGDGLRSCRMCGLRFGIWSRCLMAAKDCLRLLRGRLRRSGSGELQVCSRCGFCGLRFCAECLPARADDDRDKSLLTLPTRQPMLLLCEVCLQRNRLATEAGSWQTGIHLRRLEDPAASVASAKSSVRCRCCIGSALAIRRSQLRPLNVAVRK